MKEKDIQKLAEEWFKTRHIEFSFYKAPYYGRTRWDIFGVYDYVLADSLGNIYFYQITTAKHISDRRKKIVAFYERIGFTIPNAFILGWDSKKENFKIEQC